MLRPFAVVLACAVFAVPAVAQPAAPSRAPLVLTHPLQDKNFYLFSLFEQSPSAQHALYADATLARVAAERLAALRAAAASNQQPAHVYIAPLLWTPLQIDSVAAALASLYRDNAAVRMLTDSALRSSGVGPASAVGADLLTVVWRREAEGMNSIFSTYGLGVQPLHADIDGLAYSTGDSVYREFLQELARTVSSSSNDDALFAAPALQAALTLLQGNQRDEAVRFEPIEAGENAPALHHLASVNWKQYRYSVILVPGIGPDLPGFRLSPMGMLHVRTAAENYRKGLAPFILLSGGYVHPNQTPYSEAVEMKRSLMQDFAIPAEAILIDPHARHTTTNLRNAARILYRDGLPLDRPALIVGDPFQSLYILSEEFALRCDHELGYRPFRSLTSIAADTLVWTPEFIASLEQDPRDPLDP